MAFTGEGFSKEKALAYFGVAVGVLTLTVLALEHIENRKLRKITKELAQEQLKSIKSVNGRNGIV